MRALLAHLRTFSAGPYARPILVALLLLGPSIIVGLFMLLAHNPALVALLGLRIRPRVRIPAGRNP